MEMNNQTINNNMKNSSQTNHQQEMNILVQSDNENEIQYKPNPIIESNAERIQELLESKRFINTMRSIQDSNILNYEEIKLLPSLFLDMQEALKKSNENVLELRDTIKEKIILEKKLKIKIKEYEKEIKSLRESCYRHKGKENEFKQLYEKIKLDNINLAQNIDFANSLQKKNEKLIFENNNLKKDNEELISKIDNYEEYINLLNKIKGDLEQKNKKYKNAHGILQNEINSIEEHLKDIKVFQSQIKKMQSETNKMKSIIDNLEKEKKNLKEENIKYLSTIKSLKTELKSQLSEKISIVNELNSLKMKQNPIYYES